MPESIRRNMDLLDTIQEQCIARMKELGLNPNQVAERLPNMSRTHVCDYLSRRSSMGSHKLQHLLKILQLEIQPKD